MMNWYGVTNHQPTLLTSPAVTINSYFSGLFPTLSSVCSFPSTPLGTIFPTFKFLFKRSVAFFGTKPTSRLCFILPFNPWRYIKGTITISASAGNIINTIHFPYLLRGKGVGWPKPFTPLIPEFVIVGHSPNRQTPFTRARTATKSSSVFPVGFNGKRRITNFTSFFNHNTIMPENKRQSMGFGTTVIASVERPKEKKTDDMFEGAG